MSTSNGNPKITIKFDQETQWHIDLIDDIKAGKVKITEKRMRQVSPMWKREVVKAICLSKTGPKIVYPWHRRWWDYMRKHFQERGELGE